MPYKLSDNKLCVLLSDTGEAVPGGCHDTPAEALAHLKALEANETFAGAARFAGGKGRKGSFEDL